MTDPNQLVVDLITDVLTDYQSQDNEDLPVFAGFVDQDGNVHFGYLNCGYNDLHLISVTAKDEAILRMLAFNQDRLQRFIEEADTEDEASE